MSDKIIWSIRESDNVKISPVSSWIISLLKMIDDMIPRYGMLSQLPTIGGDLYEFSSKGLLKFILDKIHNKYDETKIDIRIVHMPMTLILDAELSKEILLSRYVKRGKVYNRLTDFFGFGIFTSNVHSKWFHQRKVMFRLFQRKTLKTIISPLTESMFQVLDEKIEKECEMDLQILLSQIGLIGFCQTIFGVDISDIYMDMMEPLNRMLVYINGAVEPFVIKWDPAFQDFVQDKEDVYDCIREIIRRAKLSSSCHSIISEELNREDLTETEIIEFTLSVVFGGHETTSKLILAIIYNLYHNPKYVDRLNKETDEYLRTHDQYELDITRRPFLKNIIQEGTRLYPSAWILSREAQEDVWFGNTSYKKGSQFLISPLIFLRSEKIWGDEAEVFNPDRFDNLTEKESATFIPFVIGSESCPGKVFAELESCIIVSKLFHEYQIEILSNCIKPNSAVTLRLVEKLPVVVRKRTIK